MISTTKACASSKNNPLQEVPFSKSIYDTQAVVNAFIICKMSRIRAVFIAQPVYLIYYYRSGPFTLLRKKSFFGRVSITYFFRLNIIAAFFDKSELNLIS